MLQGSREGSITEPSRALHQMSCFLSTLQTKLSTEITNSNKLIGFLLSIGSFNVDLGMNCNSPPVNSTPVGVQQN